MDIIVDYLNTNIERRIADTGQRVIVEVALLHDTSTRRYLSVTGNSMAEDYCSFDLLAYAFGIDVAAAVNCYVHLRDVQRSVVAHDYVYRGCNITVKRSMACEAEAVTVRHLLPVP